MNFKLPTSVWNALREALWATALVFALVELLALIPYTPTFFQPVKEALADFNYNDLYYSELNQQGPNAPQPEIAKHIILINIGGQGNRSRAELAAVLRALQTYKPKVVGLDAYFLPRADSATAELAEAMRQLPQLVVGVALHPTPAGQRPRPMDPQLRGAVATGFLNFSGNDSLNTTIRHYRPFIQEADTVCRSWSAQLVQRFDAQAFAALCKRHPPGAAQQEEIRYRGSIHSFRHLEAAELLGGLVSINELRDQLVLLGAMGEQAGQTSTYEDLFFTPLNPRQVGRTRPDMYGAVIEANIVAMLLDGRYITPVPGPVAWTLAGGVCFLLILVLNWVSRHHLAWYTLANLSLQFGLGLGLLYGSYRLYQAFAYSFDLTPSVAALAVVGTALPLYEAGRDTWRNTDASAKIGTRLGQFFGRLFTRRKPIPQLP